MDEIGSDGMDRGELLIGQLMRFRPEGLSANGWAVKAGVSRAIWTDLRRHANPSRRTLEKLLAAAGSSIAEFEALRVGEASVGLPETVDNLADVGGRLWRPAPPAPVPLVDTRLAGEWGEPGSGIERMEMDLDSVRGHVARPASMAGDSDAYALTILGDAMWPRFRPGRRLIVSPAAPVAIGDDVVVQIGTGRTVKVLVKELVRRTAGFVELRQFNPDVTFRVEAQDVAALHKVMGEAI